MHLSDLKNLHVGELVEMAVKNEVDGANRMRKQELIFALLKNQARKGESIYGGGTLEVLPDGFGFLRSPDTSYLAGTDDIYVSPVPDPPLQPAHRRQHRRRDPHAQGRRALLRAGQGGQGQRGAAGELEAQDPVREPHALSPDRAPQARARHQGRGEHHRAHHRHHRAHRQGPARPHRLPAQGRQDRADAAHRPRHHLEPPGGGADRAADRRAARGSDRDAALGKGRGRVLDVRRAGERATCRWPRW